MDKLVRNSNKKLKEIIKELDKAKNDIEEKVRDNRSKIEAEIETVKKYKEDFVRSKEKIDKMNADIEGFEQDYQNLVDRFKNDELASILVAANKEISARIDERKRKIINDKMAMNELVTKAEACKKKLVSLAAEKKTLETKCENITNIYNFYLTNLQTIITYTEENPVSLSSDLVVDTSLDVTTPVKEEIKEEVKVEEVKEDVVEEKQEEKVDFDNIDLDKVFDSNMILEIEIEDEEENEEPETNEENKETEEDTTIEIEEVPEVPEKDLEIQEDETEDTKPKHAKVEVNDDAEEAPVVPEEIFEEVSIEGMEYSDDEIIKFDEEDE